MKWRHSEDSQGVQNYRLTLPARSTREEVRILRVWHTTAGERTFHASMQCQTASGDVDRRRDHTNLLDAQEWCLREAEMGTW